MRLLKSMCFNKHVRLLTRFYGISVSRGACMMAVVKTYPKRIPNSKEDVICKSSVWVVCQRLPPGCEQQGSVNTMIQDFG